MQLSRDDFEQGVTAWLNQNVATDNNTAVIKQADPQDWIAKREPLTGHLWVQRIDKVVIGAPVGKSSAGLDEEQQDHIEDVGDIAVTTASEVESLSSRPVFHLDLYVAYSPVYRVPVLHFRARLQDGSLISLHDLLASSFFQTSPAEYPLNAINEPTNIEATDQAHFPTISQGEHPQTGLPCFYLHPCETSAALQDVLSAQGKEATPLQVIVTWFMLVSTLVDIR
ncbi:hypothetical protein P389DRAFT_179691 [Cystobasidium minutum MCA 4210]|uniref:uncharacterized protein n=1 Tax=Cystobasidium minutum MCA 4210 TaxID=1397322 RepID=UPI0034CD9F3E|eukprot:jgi/Rhomi1/179691/fgenesh1_pg.4_\